MKKSKVFSLVECGVLIALALVLSLIKVWQMPLGGAVTLVSMLPIFIISIRHGLKWGLASSFVYSLFQLLIGITLDGLLAWGLTPWMLIGCIVFDYILAYSVLGVAGAFRKFGELGVYAGIAVACLLRLISHFLSGYVVFQNLDQWEFFGTVLAERPILYSLCYNAFYMIPELVFTVAAVLVLMRIPYIKNKIFNI